jgi:hypothetical protein
MEVEEARRLRALEDECGRLKRIVADQAIQIQILKEETQKNGKPGQPTAGSKVPDGGRLEQRRSGLSGSGTSAIERLSGDAQKPQQPEANPENHQPQRGTSALRLPAHHGAVTPAGAQGQPQAGPTGAARSGLTGAQETEASTASRPQECSTFTGRAAQPSLELST